MGLSNPRLPTIVMLKEETQAFFRRHWNPDHTGHPAPTWDGCWRFVGTIPNHGKQGCYALISNERVIYIGVGAGQVGGRYEGMGLGARLMKYLRMVNPGRSFGEREYNPVPKWKTRGVDSILTLGFPSGYGYLAYSLEAYLIARLSPEYNRAKPGASKALRTNPA